MRNESHKSRIAVLRDHVGAWRRDARMSREAVALHIVEAHNASGGPERTGIQFESGSGDQFTAAKTYADRIFRWLDDETKDNNLMPANFENSILLALPMDRRLACVDELLRPLGLGGRCLDGDEQQGLAVADVQEMMREDAESQVACVAVVGGDASPLMLERAHREVVESIEAKVRMRRLLEGALSKAGRMLQGRGRQS